MGPGGGLMMKMLKTALYLAGAAILPHAAHGQAAPADQGNGLNSVIDIVVTAQKRAQSLSTVPMSGTALTGAPLAARGINDVQDLAQVTPVLNFVRCVSGENGSGCSRDRVGQNVLVWGVGVK